MDNKNRIMLGVSQGCYAEITTETPEKIVGLFTDGMGPCVCLIVTNTDRSHFFLAHVDSYMNIADPDLGLPAWIRKIQKSPGDENIKVHCGKGFQEGVFPINYWMLICKILKANNMQRLIANVEMHEVGSLAASIITRRDQDVAGYKGIEYNCEGDPLSGLQFKLRDYGFTVKDYELTKSWIRSCFVNCSQEEIEYCMKHEKVCEYTKLKYRVCQRTGLPFASDGIDTSLPFPPICCYDGKDKIKEDEQGFLEKYTKNIEKYEQEIIRGYIIVKYMSCCGTRVVKPNYSKIIKRFDQNYNNIPYIVSQALNDIGPRK